MIPTGRLVDTLLEHPILRDLGSSADQSSANNAGSQSLGNKLAVREGSLYVAVGHRIRWTNLFSNFAGYSSLQIPEIDFPIKSLLLNSSTSLLLAVGQYRVFAIDLDLPNERLPDTDLEVRYYEVGTKSPNGSEILKVIFNPVSRYDANVIILKSDQTLVSYDLSSSHTVPEEQYILQNESSSSITFSDVTERQSPFVSIALGNDAMANGLFTLFLLTQDGDIHTICPWVPKTFTLTKNQIDDIYDSAIICEHENQEAKAAKQLFRQVSWASEILKQKSVASMESKIIPGRGAEDYYILKKPLRHSKSAVQEPLLIQPYPDDLYFALDGHYATDIATVNLGFMTSIMVSWSDTTVFTLIQDSSVNTKWKADAETIAPSLALFNVGKLDSTANDSNYVKFWDIPSDCNEAIYLNIGGKDLYRVDVSPWAKSLGEAIQRDSMGDDPKVNGSFAGSKVEKLNKNNSAAISVAGIINVDGQKEKFLLLKAGEKASVAALPKSQEEIKISQMMNDIDNMTNNMGKLDVSSLPKSILSLVPFEGPLRTLLDVQLKLPDLPVDIFGDVAETVECLEYFTELANNYTEELAKLLKASLLIKRRYYTQQMELRNQLKMLGTISDFVKENEKRVDSSQKLKLDERVSRILEKQAGLEQKAHDMLDNLSKRRNMPLSDKEKKWISLLQQQQQEVERPLDGFESRARNLGQEAASVINELRRNPQDDKSTDSASDVLSSSDQIAVLRFLQKMNKHISITRNKVEAALADTVIT